MHTISSDYHKYPEHWRSVREGFTVISQMFCLRDYSLSDPNSQRVKPTSLNNPSIFIVAWLYLSLTTNCWGTNVLWKLYFLVFKKFPSSPWIYFRDPVDTGLYQKISQGFVRFLINFPRYCPFDHHIPKRIRKSRRVSPLWVGIYLNKIFEFLTLFKTALRYHYRRTPMLR